MNQARGRSRLPAFSIIYGLENTGQDYSILSKASGIFKEKNGQMYFLNWLSEAWLYARQHSSLGASYQAFFDCLKNRRPE